MRDFFLYPLIICDICKKLNIIKSPNSFGKDERLKSRKLIGELFNSGRSFSNGPLKGLYIIDRESQPSLKCGFTVSSRSFKKAVDRNRIKRLMREAYRTQNTELQSVVNDHQFALAVFIIFRGQELPDYKTIHDKMAEIISKLIKLAIETTPQNS